MKLTLTGIALLCACTVYANKQPEWLTAATQERAATLQDFEANRQKADETLRSLTDEPAPATTPTDAPLPENQEGETVVEADGGMLFDVANAALVYMGNVRVSDKRLKMRCAERLYIRLPQSTLDEGKKEASETVAPKKTEPNTPKTPKETKDTPAAFSSPISVETATAQIDTVSHQILLIGHTDAAVSLNITQEDNHLRMGASNGTPAQALADANGDIYLSGGTLEMSWVDEQGQISTLTNTGGLAYYQAAEGKLILTGASDLRTPEGCISCTEELCISLLQEPREQDDDNEIMPQFGKLRICGVSAVSARGHVAATRPAIGNTAAASVTGNSLSYDGTTGACQINGDNTTLVYGENKLCTNGSISLAENGDICLQGDSISGNYSRPAENNEAPPIAGTFCTKGQIRFDAAAGTITAPAGITLKDDFCDFTANGPITLTLTKNPEAELPERKKLGMLNPAIAAYTNVEHINATGGIRVHYIQDPEKSGMTLMADDADIDMTRGTVSLTTAGTTTLKYDAFCLTADSAGATTSLVLSPEGDLTMQGDKLTAELPTKDGVAHLYCTDTLTLHRESGCLQLGAGAILEAPQGRLTANGPLRLTLLPGEPEKARPLLAQFPHLVYNYAGLQQADTEQGGTIQTPDAAMRCSGPIHVSMNPEAQTDSHAPEAAIQLATAEGDVAVTGKDTTGKTLTAYGDKLTIDGATGQKRLSGKQVILQDANNTHTASGANAAIVLDKNNNVRVTGAKQSTTASNIRKQIEKQQKHK